MKRAGNVLLWVLTALQAFVMTGSGIQKFTSPAWERMFRVWGYPDHFYIVIGVVEAVCGLGLLLPRTASACALTLAGVMAGAAVTQVTRNHGSGVGEIVFMTMLLIIAYARWPGILARRRGRAQVAAVSGGV
jgi:putative oxidoreductase